MYHGSEPKVQLIEVDIEDAETDAGKLLTDVIFFSARLSTRKWLYASSRVTRGPAPVPPGCKALAVAIAESVAASGLQLSDPCCCRARCAYCADGFRENSIVVRMLFQTRRTPALRVVLGNLGRQRQVENMVLKPPEYVHLNLAFSRI